MQAGNIGELQPTIFISYASEDVGAAAQLCEALRAAGFTVWFDRNELRGGDAWDHSIREQIRCCSLFIPIISQHTEVRAEAYFRLEWKLAIDRSYLMTDDQKFLLPVVIDGTHGMSARVPDRLRQRQWTHIPGGRADDEFVAHVAHLLSGERSATSVSTRLRTQPGGSATVQSNAQAIVVLPFVNMSDNRENEFFSDGVMEEVLAHLSRVSDLHVISRTSAMVYKDSRKPIGEIAAELGVGSVLEGSVRRAGNRVRVNVQLIDAGSDKPLWGERYDRDLDDIFAVQSEIALEIAEALNARLGFSDEEQLRRRPTHNMAAYDLYLQGQQAARTLVAPVVQRGIEQLQQAIELDPDFAPAHAALGQAYLFSAHWGRQRGRADLEDARRHAWRALALDPSNLSARIAMGFVRAVLDLDWQGAIADLEKISHADTNNVEGHFWLGICLYLTGQFSAAAAAHSRAFNLDPHSANIASHYGLCLGMAGELDQAEVVLRAAIDAHPTFFDLPNFLAIVLQVHARREEAARWMKRVCELTNRHPVFLSRYAAYLSLAGKTEQAQALEPELRKHLTDPANSVLDRAFIAWPLDEIEQTVTLLTESVELRHPLAYWGLRVLQDEEHLRGCPGLEQLYQRVLPTMQRVSAD